MLFRSDVLLWNEEGEITESTIANVVLEDSDGDWWTPPVRCGLLAGILRDRLIREGRVREGVVTTGELGNYRQIWLINSVRGVMKARLRTD